ncbi:acidic leucine-rich nuclear phosphoprotein 32-related protein 2-like [Seriola dumerili]|uniref:acidic leucine-rich nuclear phosphoprotein 32-related protein 2-like n=1 Tax=Seriola dumerili TaxID=41447 RepID=UPI000BBE4D9A|nr:acidic leucine-rich nuclear phosphoprotein 32-related protein 2-like [Seriola dumerili]
MGDSDNPKSTTTIIILSISLFCLIALLIFLYKKLNREANGEYTIQRMVYKEGGVRDRVRGAALTLETHLGVQLWPRNDTDEDGEEMQVQVQDEEEQLEEGGSQESYSEGDDNEEEDGGGDNAPLCDKTKGKGDGTSDEKTSLDDSEAGEQTVLTDQSEAKEETNEKREEKEEKVGEGEGKGEASGGAGLLIDFKQFSGSAIWSEEEGGGGTDKDVTVL